MDLEELSREILTCAKCPLQRETLEKALEEVV
jgi:hypothetical protein